MRSGWILSAVLCLGSKLFAADAPPEGVIIAEYKGWPDSVTLPAPDAKIKAVIVPLIGGRIQHYGPDDANIIYEHAGSDGKTLAKNKNFWAGGYNLDIGPETRRLTPHPDLWMGPYEVKPLGPNTVNTLSVLDKSVGIQLDKTFKMDPKTGALHIMQRMKNIGEKDTNFCLWDRTLCKGGGFAFFTVNPKSKFAKGWAQRIKYDGEGAFNTTDPNLENVKVIDGVVLIECKGKEGKMGGDTNAGWLAYVRGKQLYIKIFPYDPKGNYSDAGNSVEIYWSPMVAEIEPLGPEIVLKPGEEATFPETWLLIDLPEEATTFEAARKLVDRVTQAVDTVRKGK